MKSLRRFSPPSALLALAVSLGLALAGPALRAQEAAAPAAPAAPAEAKPAPKPLAGFERTRMRIIELLGPRLIPAKLAENPPNPFASPSASGASSIIRTGDTLPADPVVDAPAPATPEAPVDEIVRLAQTLKIGGTVMRRGQASLIVNSNVYTEGDMLTVREGEILHLIRIKRITRTELVLEMDDKEAVVKLR